VTREEARQRAVAAVMRNRLDRLAAYARLRHQSRTVAEWARVFEVTPRTIQRYNHELREVP
jgi:predicted DNA-binding transcriptional regulator YafY